MLSAAPACGAAGAARVAATQAAIETIRDSYIIGGGYAADNVSIVQRLGYATTWGSITNGGGYGTYRGTTAYTPGPIIPVGSQDQALLVPMFRNGDAGFEQAVPAWETLGPDWQDKVASGVATCLR